MHGGYECCLAYEGTARVQSVDIGSVGSVIQCSGGAASEHLASVLVAALQCKAPCNEHV